MNAEGFRASLFHPDFGNEVVEGLLTIDRDAVRFHSPERTVEIPIGSVMIELDDEGGRVCFNDSAQPELTLFTLDRSILEHPSFVRSNPLRAQAGAIVTRREISRRLRVVGYFALGCVLLTWIGSWITGLAIDVLVARVPPEWEEKIGEMGMKELQEEFKFLENTNRLARLKTLAEPLLAKMPGGPDRYKFYLVENPYPNALALPGGHIIVFTGLIDMSDTPEELLGVLAHELAHVTRKHGVRKIISAAGPLLIFQVFLRTGDDLLNLLSAGSGLLVLQSYSKEYEREADDQGWEYLLEAGIDPRGLAMMFRRLQVFEANQIMLIDLPESLRSHPALEKRIERLDRKWEKLRTKPQFAQTKAMDWRKP